MTDLRAATPTLPPSRLVALCIQAAREIERLKAKIGERK